MQPKMPVTVQDLVFLIGQQQVYIAKLEAEVESLRPTPTMEPIKPPTLDEIRGEANVIKINPDAS